MSGNSSRKFKRYKEALERRRYFGDLAARDDFGILQLTALGAALGIPIYGTSKHDLAKAPKPKRKTSTNEHPK